MQVMWSKISRCKICSGYFTVLTMLLEVARNLPLQEDLSHVGSVLGVENTIQDTQLPMEDIGGIFITN